MVQFPRWQAVAVLLICLVGVVFAVPSLFDRSAVESLPGWLPNQQISLGLDLQGGSHLLLAVDVAAVIQEDLEALEDTVRRSLRKGAEGETEDLGDTTTLADPSVVAQLGEGASD